jgi:hypothetical protein
MANENEKQEQQQPIGTEPEDLKFVRELFEKLDKMKLVDLLAEFEKQFYLNACAAIELFQKICLNASGEKKRTEAAKFILNLFKDANFTKNLALIGGLRGRIGKGAAAAPDAKADWIEPKKKG